MAPVAVTAFTSTTALGAGLHAQAAALTARRSGMRRNDFGPQPLPCWIGRVDGVEAVVLPESLQGWDCATTAWLGWPCSKTAWPLPCRRPRSATAPNAWR